MQLYYRTERREARKLDEGRQEAAILLLGASRFLTMEVFVGFPFVSTGSGIVLQMRRDLQIHVVPRMHEFSGRFKKLPTVAASSHVVSPSQIIERDVSLIFSYTRLLVSRIRRKLHFPALTRITFRIKRRRFSSR